MDQIWQDMYRAAKAVLGERTISDYVTAGGVSAAVRSHSSSWGQSVTVPRFSPSIKTSV